MFGQIQLADFFQLLHAMLLGLFTVSAIMAAVWYFARKIHNAGIVDVAWCASFSILAILYALIGQGDLAHRLAICLMTIVWSLRLTVHLYRRVRRLHPEEDGRYAALRKEWGSAAQRNLFIFFQIQGISLAVLSAPMIVACQIHTGSITLTDYAGVSVWLIGVLGESIADEQLHQFTTDPSNKGKTCQKGLWGYSRHPNYFFEWVIWIGFFIFSLSAPLGIYTIFVPILMLHFLLNVTGVKLTEEHAIRSRGEEYRRYQASTSAFVPWFKRTQQS